MLLKLVLVFVAIGGAYWLGELRGRDLMRKESSQNNEVQRTTMSLLPDMASSHSSSGSGEIKIIGMSREEADANWRKQERGSLYLGTASTPWNCNALPAVDMTEFSHVYCTDATGQVRDLIRAGKADHN